MNTYNPGVCPFETKPSESGLHRTNAGYHYTLFASKSLNDELGKTETPRISTYEHSHVAEMPQRFNLLNACFHIAPQDYADTLEAREEVHQTLVSDQSLRRINGGNRFLSQMPG
jgi:hypothetical protein